jgi:hypothetical protein
MYETATATATATARCGVSILKSEREQAKEKKKQATKFQHLSPSSPRKRGTLQLQRLLRKSRKVHLLMSILGHILARSDAMDRHLGVELQAAEELGRDEEVLASAAAVFAGGGAGDGD